MATRMRSRRYDVFAALRCHDVEATEKTDVVGRFI